MIKKKYIALTLLFCSLVAISSCSSLEKRESPSSFESRMEKTDFTPLKSKSEATFTDPVALGEYASWSVYSKENEYELTMYVNYSLRGEEVLDLYYAYLDENWGDISYQDYSRERNYKPKEGYELILINISFGFESESGKYLYVEPIDFDLALKSGLRLPTTRENLSWPYFHYHNNFAGFVENGFPVKANLIFEVPKEEEILLALFDNWFAVE